MRRSHRQVFTQDREAIVFAFLDFPESDGVFDAADDTGGLSVRTGETEVTLGRKVWHNLGINRTEGAGMGAGFAAYATHIVAHENSVILSFKGVKRAGRDTAWLFATAADLEKVDLFSQGENAMLGYLRLIEVTTLNCAFIAGVTLMDVNDQLSAHTIIRDHISIVSV